MATMKGLEAIGIAVGVISFMLSTIFSGVVALASISWDPPLALLMLIVAPGSFTLAMDSLLFSHSPSRWGMWVAVAIAVMLMLSYVFAPAVYGELFMYESAPAIGLCATGVFLTYASLVVGLAARLVTLFISRHRRQSQ